MARRKSSSHARQTQKQQRKHPGKTRANTSTTSSKKTPKKASSIIEKLRKTELCRNYEQQGFCPFGDNCAFAHGVDDIRHKTLRELEKEGHIPDASNYHACLCMTWVATGDCPNGPRCVFIHDDRVSGSSRGNSGVRLPQLDMGADDTGSSLLSFPDKPRDPDSREFPADEVRYDIDHGIDAETRRDLSAVFHLWYSFISSMKGSSALAGTKNNEDSGAKSDFPKGNGDDIDATYDAAAVFTKSYKDAVTASASLPATSDVSTLSASSDRDGSCTSPSTSSSVVKFENHQLPPEVAKKCNAYGVSHALPVFRTLRIGAPPDAVDEDSRSTGSLHLAEAGEGHAAILGDDDGSYFSCPCSSSSWYSATSSPTADGGGGTITVSNDSASFPSRSTSCSSSVEENDDAVIDDINWQHRFEPAMNSPSIAAGAGTSSASLSPPPGFDTGVGERLPVFVGFPSNATTSPATTAADDMFACGGGGDDSHVTCATEGNSSGFPRFSVPATRVLPHYLVVHHHHGRLQYQQHQGQEFGGGQAGANYFNFAVLRL